MTDTERPNDNGGQEDTATTAAAPDYAHCACGAPLVMDDERAAGVCEACGYLGADGRLYATPEEATAVPQPTGDEDELAEPAKSEPPHDVKLPFPALPFDSVGAVEDICAKRRVIDASIRQWDELHKRAGDLKKQIEAAEGALALAIRQYDEARREAEAEALRQEKLRDAYEQKAADEAAKKAQPDLPIDAPVASPVAPEAPVVSPEAPIVSPTPLSDALPACACGHALALDSEVEAGQCEECAQAV